MPPPTTLMTAITIPLLLLLLAFLALLAARHYGWTLNLLTSTKTKKRFIVPIDLDEESVPAPSHRGVIGLAATFVGSKDKLNEGDNTGVLKTTKRVDVLKVARGEVVEGVKYTVVDDGGYVDTDMNMDKQNRNQNDLPTTHNDIHKPTHIRHKKESSDATAVFRDLVYQEDLPGVANKRIDLSSSSDSIRVVTPPVHHRVRFATEVTIRADEEICFDDDDDDEVSVVWDDEEGIHVKEIITGEVGDDVVDMI